MRLLSPRNLFILLPNPRSPLQKLAAEAFEHMEHVGEMLRGHLQACSAYERIIRTASRHECTIMVAGNALAFASQGVAEAIEVMLG